MRIIKRTITPALAFLLALLMAIYLFPADVAAAAYGGNDPESQSNEQGEETVDALFELTNLRTEDTKYIKMSDGTVQALVYDTAVHVQDESGVWQDIDNRLTVGNNTVDSARVKFAKKITGNGELFTLHDGNKKVTLSLADAIKKTPVTVVNDGTTDEKYATKLEELSTLSKVVSSVRYNGILPNTDVEYILSGNDLKENIIINDVSEEYIYTFELSLNNLTASLADDGSIELLDNNTCIYTMPVPFMYDAVGKYSESVSYSLSESNVNGKYTLIVTADPVWINDKNRTFPVTVDPTITLTSNPLTSSITRYEMIQGSTCISYSYFIVSETRNAFIELRNVPNPLEMPILSATMNFSIASCSSGLAGAHIDIHSIDYNGSFSDLDNGEVSVEDLDLSYVDTYVVNGTTTATYNLLTADFIIKSYGNSPLFYMLTMTDNEYPEEIWFYSCEEITHPKPTLTITYGYVHPTVLLSSGVNDYTNTFWIENTGGSTLTDKKLLATNNSSIPSMHTYSPNDARANVVFLSGSSGIKIYFNYDMVYLYVNSAGNVRVGSTQDEWVIIKTNNDYLIVLAEDPTLALTRTSSGIVVSQLESNNTSQTWEICKGTEAQYEYHYLDSGIYYMNSFYVKNFMITESSYSLKQRSGTEMFFGNNMAWDISFVGNGKYTIRSVQYPTKYLMVTPYAIYLSEIGTTIPDGALLTIFPSGTGYTIKSATTNTYLTATSTYPYHYQYSGTGQYSGNDAKWRLCKKDQYHELTDFTFDNINDSQYLVGDTDVVTITYGSVNGKTFVDRISDFSFTSSNTNIVDFPCNPYVNEFRCISGGQESEHGNKSTGAVNIIVKHIPTGIIKSFRIWSGDAIWCFKTSSVRLSAPSSDTIKVNSSKASTAEGFGMQLWYTEYAGKENNTNYYYIHSLHVRDSHNGDNNVLAYNGSSVKLTEKNDSAMNEAKKKWSFTKIGDSYRIVNKYYGKYLKALGTSDDSSVTVSNDTYNWTLEPMKQLGLPDCTWQGGYNDNSTVHHIKIDIDNESLSDETVLNDLLTSSTNYNELFGVWNNISSNIVIHYPGENTNNYDNLFVITISEDDLDEGVVGQTLGDDDITKLFSDWNYCHITIATDYADDDSDYLKETIRHEFGHALKLSHVFSETFCRYYSDLRYYPYYVWETEVLSIMNYESPGTMLSYDTIAPTFLDKVNLILKWGA